jgi:hypothetical protein
MNHNSKSRTTLFVASMMMACLLVLSTSTVAQSAQSGSGVRQCSNKTLKGDYGCSVQGVLLNIPGLPPEATFVGLTMTKYDGNGGVSWLEHVTFNGAAFNPGWAAGSGSYIVNSNCTGEALVTTPNSPVPLHLFLVVVDNGKEIHEVLNTDALATVCKRVN